MGEQLPLASIHEAVLEFLRLRDDAVVFGAQAVNAYVGEPRMSQGIDLVSTHAAELAEELREHLSERFHIAVRVIGDAKDIVYFKFRNPATVTWLICEPSSHSRTPSESKTSWSRLRLTSSHKKLSLITPGADNQRPELTGEIWPCCF